MPAQALPNAGRGAASLLALLVTLSGCGSGPGAQDDGGWGGTIQDSAGVTVVRNTGSGLWGDTPRWIPRETLVVGGDESRPETLFGSVADVASDGDGNLYVLDQMASEVRVFDDQGALLHVIGGPGRGPGELSRFASSLLLSGDTLRVADWGQARMNLFNLDGTFLGSHTLDGPAGARSWWRRGADGALYFRALSRFTDERGRWRGWDVLFRAGEPGTPPDTVMVFDYPEADLGTRATPRVPLLVNTPSWTVLRDGRVAWTTLQSNTVTLTAPGGAVVGRIHRDAWVPREPTHDDERRLKTLMAERLQQLGGDPQAVDRMVLEYPELLPTLTSVHTGPAGTLWVQRTGSTDAVRPEAVNTPDPTGGWGGSDWDILDQQGRYLGTLLLPADLHVMRVDDSEVLGVRRDAMGVARVVRYRLEVG